MSLQEEKNEALLFLEELVPSRVLEKYKDKIYYVDLEPIHGFFRITWEKVAEALTETIGNEPYTKIIVVGDIGSDGIYPILEIDGKDVEYRSWIEPEKFPRLFDELAGKAKEIILACESSCALFFVIEEGKTFSSLPLTPEKTERCTT